jgi:hypothetical protein
MPVVRVTIMSWCFQFLLDLLWIPLAAFFHDRGLSLHVLGMVFAVNLGVRLVPNVLATRAGVKTDMVCMVCGLLCFTVNFVFPDDTWAIFVMAAGGGMTFVRAHLSVHGKLAAGGSKENLSLAAKWSGAARNFGTVVAFVVPVMVYKHFGWSAVVGSGMAAMIGYLVLAAVQHSYAGDATDVDELAEGLVEQAPATGSISQIPWIDWIMAAAFCITELQMNVQAAAVPTTLMRQFELPVSICGPIQALGQLIAMGFLMLLSKGYGGIFQKRPLNMITAFFGTFLGMSVLCWSTALDGERAAQIIFILSLYFFYIMAYTAQVTMLECLTGVLDMQNAIVVIGISEMIGCACSLFGGYLGPVLLEVNPCAPFVLQMAIALVTTMMVAFCLGHRAVSQMLVVCETQEQYLASVQDADIERRPSVANSLNGLKEMKKRRDSYIGIEKRYRKRTASSGSLASMGSCSSLASMADDAGGLTQALLANPTSTDMGADAGVAAAPHAEAKLRSDSGSTRVCSKGSTAETLRMQSKEVPVPDVVTSTFSGRQLKKTMACFDRAYVDIDTDDHEVNRFAVQRLMMRQPSHEGHPVGVYAGA